MSNKKNEKSIIESLLFVSEKPISIKEISDASGIMQAEVQKFIKQITDEYSERGIRITRKGDKFSFTSAPENSKEVSLLLNEELRHDLSQAALETLAIITYKQPLTRTEIEEIRGVNSDYIVRNLIIRGLITEVGRKETIGKPILYGTTMEFIQFFGLDNEENIPKLEEITLFEVENAAS